MTTNTKILPSLTLLILAIVLVLGPGPLETKARAFLQSAYIGGWPGICEDDHCYDDGQPFDQSPQNIRKAVLEHQIKSDSCPTDLIFISLEYPESTSNEALDKLISNENQVRIKRIKEITRTLTCDDILGCDGECLPIGFEGRTFVFQSSPEYISFFKVERFFGNFRGQRHLRGTITYSFKNYNLRTGKSLAISNIFPQKDSIPLFWDKIDQILAESNNCPSAKLLIGGKKPSKNILRDDDLLLSAKGATIALTTPKVGPCRSQAIDLPKIELIELGAQPELWYTPQEATF